MGGDTEMNGYVYIHSEIAGKLIYEDPVTGEKTRFERDLYTVGFYTPEGRFEPESDHSTRDEAASRVAYLNGGQK
jgi:hypothetical protein